MSTMTTWPPDFPRHVGAVVELDGAQLAVVAVDDLAVTARRRHADGREITSRYRLPGGAGRLSVWPRGYAAVPGRRTLYEWGSLTVDAVTESGVTATLRAFGVTTTGHHALRSEEDYQAEAAATAAFHGFQTPSFWGRLAACYQSSEFREALKERAEAAVFVAAHGGPRSSPGPLLTPPPTRAERALEEALAATQRENARLRQQLAEARHQLSLVEWLQPELEASHG